MTQKIIFETSGDGYWSNIQRPVLIRDMRIGPFIDDEFDAGDSPDYGELCVYFEVQTWDVRKHGLIYTDKRFLKELRAFLKLQGLPGDDVEYSEQGMQGDNYVSLDVGKKFMKAWGKKFGIDWDAVVSEQRKSYLYTGS